MCSCATGMEAIPGRHPRGTPSPAPYTVRAAVSARSGWFNIFCKGTRMFHRLFSGSTVVKSIVLFSVTGMLSLCLCKASPDKKAQPAPDKSGEVTSTKKTEEPATTVKKERTLVVYYFHGNYRCRSCTMIENLTKQAVTTGFVDQLADGRVELKVVNVDETVNKHFTKDYKLYTKSVILSDIEGGKESSWKNLEKVWTLLGDETKFITYIQSEIKALL